MDADEFARKWERRAAAMPEALHYCIRAHTAEVYAASKRHLQHDIYDKAPDTRSWSYKKGKRHVATAAEAARSAKQGMYNWRTEGRGKAKWQRTGDLAKAEHWFMEAGVGIILNSMAYALPRHDLGLSPGDPRAVFGSSRNSTRIAPWRKDAVAEVADRKDEIYSRIIGEALK